MFYLSLKKIFFFSIVGLMMIFLYPNSINKTIKKQTTQENNSTKRNNTTNENNETDVLINVLSKPWVGDFDGMKKKRVIRVFVVPSKIMYHIYKGKKSGISYELVSLFEKSLNKLYSNKNKHLKLHIVFMPISRDKLIPSLLSGHADIIIGDITITPKRKELIAFSDSFFSKINKIIITSKPMPELQDIQDLAGKEIFVRRSSSYWEYLEKLNLAFKDMNISEIKLISVPEVLEDTDLMEMVNANLIQMIVVDKYKAKLWSQILPNIILHEDIVITKNGEFAWMIRKNSPLLLKEINTFVKKHKEGTLLGNILKNRYVKKYTFVNNALTEKELKKFEKVVDLFKKYSTQYSLNYLLMLAQGYQESKLNQNAKSPVGAIGIMQLMPKTGKSMKVGDIHKIEANIHAGIKYHRWLEDRYFKDSNMTDLDKALFTFASYNAGPARIRGLRSVAKKRGLNPDIWIDNVELIASEKIGAETVTYVANIFKYYVAYTLYEKKEQARDKAKKMILEEKTKK